MEEGDPEPSCDDRGDSLNDVDGSLGQIDGHLLAEELLEAGAQTTDCRGLASGEETPPIHRVVSIDHRVGGVNETPVVELGRGEQPPVEISCDLGGDLDGGGLGLKRASQGGEEPVA